MKKTKMVRPVKKLVLGRETVRVLTTDDLKHVAGASNSYFTICLTLRAPVDE
jgi:hypothetical protein